jgi:dTDP-glucose 4,6-dehydratase
VYDEAKRFAEATTVAYRTSNRVNTAIVRIFNTFGPRMRPDDGRAIPTFIGQALRGEPLSVAGDGSQTRSICYVDDLVEGVVRMLWSNLAGPVNLGNPRELSILELADLIVKLVGSPSAMRFVPLPQDDPLVRRPDITTATRELGWQPQVGVEDGLRRTIDWFSRHPAFASRFSDQAQPAG